MPRYVFLAALVGTVAVAAVALASRRGGDEGTSSPPPSSRVERAHALIRECGVRSTVSLHSGAFFLELKDGSRLDLPRASERQIYAEIQRAAKRCGTVPIAME